MPVRGFLLVVHPWQFRIFMRSRATTFSALFSQPFCSSSPHLSCCPRVKLETTHIQKLRFQLLQKAKAVNNKTVNLLFFSCHLRRHGRASLEALSPLFSSPSWLVSCSEQYSLLKLEFNYCFKTVRVNPLDALNFERIRWNNGTSSTVTLFIMQWSLAFARFWGLHSFRGKFKICLFGILLGMPWKFDVAQ